MSGIYFTGLGSGIDTDAMVAYLMQLERQPLARVATRKQELQARESCWQEIRSRMIDLEQSARELQRSSLYGQKIATADREGLVEVTAASAAAIGSYRLEILSLAQAHSVASVIMGSEEAGPGDALGLSGSFTLNGAGVTVDEGDSLQDICAQINALEEAGVTAAVIDRRLVLTRVETGAAKKIELVFEDNDLRDALKLETVQEAQDAELRLNGLEVTRSGNTIDDLLEGVTFKLLQAGDKLLTITVTDDYRPLISKIEGFIRQYNSTYQYVKTQIAVDPEAGTRGTLHGESSLNQVLAAIRRTITGAVEVAGSPNCLAAIGISTAKWDSAEPEGTLILDQGKLKEILEAEPGAVGALLSDEKGVAGRLGGYLGNLTRYGEGLIHYSSKGIENRIRDLDRRAETLELRLEKREQTLRRQFLAAERIIGRMNSQGQWLEQQMALMTRGATPDARSR